MTDNASERLAAIHAAMFDPDNPLSSEDMTDTGLPRVDAIADRLPEDFDLTAAERDEAWLNPPAFDPPEEPEESEGDIEEVEPAFSGVQVRIDYVSSEPQPLYVHGVGQFSLRKGDVVCLPQDAVSALLNSDCRITILKETKDV